MENNSLTETDVFAELARVKSEPKPIKIHSDFSDNSLQAGPAGEGQLAIDVFHDEENVYVQSAIAGVKPENLDIQITKESVVIKGAREQSKTAAEKDFLYQECFWGKFSRIVVLPEEINPEKSRAALKSGVLTVTLPKLNSGRKSFKIKK